MAPMAESFYKCLIRYYSIYATILMRDEEKKIVYRIALICMTNSKRNITALFLFPILKYKKKTTQTKCSTLRQHLCG